MEVGEGCDEAEVVCPRADAVSSDTRSSDAQIGKGFTLRDSLLLLTPGLRL
jgi:hypothetical protein